MDSISIKVPVKVKAKLTEKLKERLIAESEEKLNRVELDLQQLAIQEKKAVEENKEDPRRLQIIHDQFGAERAKMLQFRHQTSQQLEDIKKLAIGAEITNGNVFERQVELRVGDNLHDIMNVEVLVEDDKVIAIRG